MVYSLIRFLSYSHLGVTDNYLPPTLSLTTDFWETAKKYEQTLQDYVPRMLKSAAADFKSTKFTDITSSMNSIVHATATFRDNIKGTLDARHVTLDTLTKELEGIFMGIVHDLEKIPPPNKAPGHTEREEMVDKIMDDTELALNNLATRHGIDADVVTTYLGALKPQVHALIVAVGMSISPGVMLNLLIHRIGDINEQHPQLLPALGFSVAAMLIPQSWILKPFLSMFGFGPAGPIRGALIPCNNHAL